MFSSFFFFDLHILFRTSQRRSFPFCSYSTCRCRLSEYTWCPPPICPPPICPPPIFFVVCLCFLSFQLIPSIWPIAIQRVSRYVATRFFSPLLDLSSVRCFIDTEMYYIVAVSLSVGGIVRVYLRAGVSEYRPHGRHRAPSQLLMQW